MSAGEAPLAGVDDVAMLGPVADRPLPSGRAMRALTRRTTRLRTGAGAGEVLSDLYVLVFSTVVGVTMAMGAAGQLVDEWSRPDAVPDAVLDPAWAAILAIVAILGAVLSVASRLGPVALGAAEAAWWLPLPADRRSLLRPAAIRVPAVTAFAVGASGGVLGVLAFPARTVAGLVLGAVGAAAVAVALVAVAGIVQTADLPRRTLTLVGDGLVAAMPVAGLVLVLARPAATGPTTGLPAVAAVAAVGLAALAVAALDLRLGRVPDAELRERGAVAGQAIGAVVSLDSRELGRALTENPRHQRRRKSSRLTWVSSPARALVTADGLLLVRSPRRVAQVVVAGCLPVAAILAGAWHAGVTVPALLIGGYVATLATAEGSRRGEAAPVLDALLPLDARTVRRLRLVVPGVVMLGWSLAVFAVVAARTGDWMWPVLGAVAAPVWAGAAVRGAYRRAPDWSGALVASPFGPLPPGVASVLASGPDVVVLGLAPAIVAFVVGAVPPVVVVVQGIASGVVLLVGSHVSAARRATTVPAR